MGNGPDDCRHKQRIDFSVAGNVRSYALDALRWAVENGIINGNDGGILDSKSLAARA